MSTERRSRAQARAEMEAGILRVGREQLAERGAAALSLREVARSLGVVSSAVYRYVSSRDELLTLLLVDAYSGLADDVDARLERARRRSAQQRLLVLAEAMREWALAHPAQWGLIYGAPVPGYSAPESETTDPGTRVMARLAAIAAEGSPDRPGPRGPLRTYLAEAVAALEPQDEEQAAGAITPVQAQAAVEAWCAIVGTISVEIFGQLGPEPGEQPRIGQGLLRSTVDTQADRMGLPA